VHGHYPPSRANWDFGHLDRAKLERPGSNPELNTLVRVERALEAPLLEYA